MAPARASVVGVVGAIRRCIATFMSRGAVALWLSVQHRGTEGKNFSWKLQCYAVSPVMTCCMTCIVSDQKRSWWSGCVCKFVTQAPRQAWLEHAPAECGAAAKFAAGSVLQPHAEEWDHAEVAVEGKVELLEGKRSGEKGSTIDGSE
eukprot:CAMPEP_0174372538 /NCGR_PEP_ID=MMETSP0811_2-20130205/104005_1 /TAXON_ID=73025 ORGANISM="Eutreptiella gymnastica-like, Strain CCMP1594" /NCGR_SAMPLE_ID=MMETSP0811_2 /ASSEMBLY_ACC=CAM_ASM_000667 /LENGTH=146 /DNA_ID=CAMNT_0015520067 /DNA_START=213 /DNA_END=652 /DNA_ORIENTATION=+